MDTQNVSAQLYFKQLPKNASSQSYGYGVEGVPKGSVETDAQIENAFQKQLDLSEYYKSPEVFNTIKQKFTDQTIEGQDMPKEEIKEIPTPPPVATKTPVGPTDFLYKFIKESFGSGSDIMGIIIMFLFVAIIIGAIVLSILNPKRNFNNGPGNFNNKSGLLNNLFNLKKRIN